MFFLLHLLPFIEKGLLRFSKTLPEHIAWLYELIGPLLTPLSQASMDPDALQDVTHEALYWITSQLRSIAYNAIAVEFGLLYSFLTPLLTFYCMRGWPQITRFSREHASRLLQEKPDAFFDTLARLMYRALNHQIMACIARGTLHILFFG
jgi:predicted PurR-regulated permease PerM